MSEAYDVPSENLENDFDIIEGRNIELDFGTIEIFKERTKYITFYRPMTDDDIAYTIKKNESLRMIKDSFSMNHYHGVLKPNQNFNMAVTYAPTLTSVKDVQIFDYTDSNYELIKITLCGVAIGPYCTISTKRLEFYITPERKLSEHKIEISNMSAGSARFKIDEVHYDSFRVEPLEGVIKPYGYKYVTVRFCPKKPGIFSRMIFCLVWNSELLVLHVVGIYTTQVGMVDANLKYYSNDQTFGFAKYFDDCLTVRKDVPPFSLSTNYLEFRSVMVNSKQPRTQVTSLTNHLNNPIIVNWNRGNQKLKIFKITPNRVEIAKQSSVQFQVEFNPDENYNVFQETIMAQVEWDSKSEQGSSSSLPMTSVPLTCTLRAQGHSFPENEGWISQVEILPDQIYWQPSTPGEFVRTTFMLRNRSHLPVLYKLVPPNKTNIIAKPMMGKFRNNEIIAVQLQTEANKVKVYIEEWKLVCNGREDKPISLYFHGETCVPTIEIGKNNKINAGPVQDGSEKEVQVMMKNKSYYAICYQFSLIKNTLLSIKPSTGTINANDSTKLCINITGSHCAPKREMFTCQMRIVDGSGAVSGECYEEHIEIYTICSYSELCACPNSKDFGRLPFGRRIKAEFEAVNFGDTAIFFQTCQSGQEQHDKNFRIKPCFGEVKPKSSKRFSVNGIISQVGNQKLQFGYYNRMVKDSPLVTGEPITLYNLNYFAEFPIIQIKEVVEHNFGHLFGKNDFFLNYLQIHRLNKVIREIPNNENVELQLSFPEFELQKKEFYIKLAVANTTDFDTTVIVKRKKICDCRLEEVSAGISERKKGFNCPHRASLSMELQDTRFFAGTTRFLTIIVRYCLKGETTMCYTLQLTNNRIIDLYFSIYSIPPETPTLSTYKREFALKLKNVYLGTTVAPVQMYWMYNNTKKLLNYEFDTKDIEHMCKMDAFKVLEILNPVDQILPYHNKALLVKFHPIEIKTYSIEVNVTYYFPERENEVSRTFLIEGEGIMEIEKYTEPKEAIPRVYTFSSNFPISLSLEYIDIKMVPVWSKRKELIFIKNNARGKTIQCIWRIVKIDNIIEISTEPTFSVLRPKDIQPVIITIKTFSEPCIGGFVLACEVDNYTDKIIHQITEAKHLEAETRINEFMQGEPPRTKRPINPIKVPEEPEILFATVMINITTVHTKDLDDYMDTTLQLKQYPNQSIENIPKSILKKYYAEEKPLNFPEKKSDQPIISVNERVIFCKVLEDILSDALFSNIMKSLLKKHTQMPLHKYQEFVMDDKSVMERKIIKTALSNQDIEFFRKREIERFFNQLKVTDLSNILQTLIYESMMKLVQCHKPNYNLDQLHNEIEKSLHSCKEKNCPCNKHTDS